MSRTPLLLPLAFATLLQAGCATRQSMDEAYDRALAPWQGASEQTLRERWGKPVSEEQTPSGSWLTYVVTNPATVSNGGPRIGIGIGGFGGARVGVGGGVGVSTPLGKIGGNGSQGATCTTRFLVEHGVVTSWTYDGDGCGATN